MRRNSQILITAVERYINDLQYIAKENKKSVNNMMNFLIINYLLHWSYQLGMDPDIFKQLFKHGEKLIAKDEYLSHYIKDTQFHLTRGDIDGDGTNDPFDIILNSGINRHYAHVNVPQSYQASGLIFDESKCVTIK